MNLKFRFEHVIFLLGLGFTLFVFGFILTSKSRAVDAPPIQVTAGSDSITIRLEAPAFTTPDNERVEIQDQADRYTFDQEEGQPVLPHRVYNLALPPDADPASLSMSVSDIQEETLPGTFNPILAAPKVLGCAAARVTGPSCGGQSLLQSLASPRLATPSRLDVSQSAARLLPYGQLRKWRYARVDFSPFAYDSNNASLSVVHALTATITFKHDPAMLNEQLLNDTVMDDVAASLFDNYDQAQPGYTAQAQAHPAAVGTAPADYVIISTDDIYNNSDLQTFITFQNNHGHTTTGVSMTTIQNVSGATKADKIRQFLRNQYTAWGMRYVLLVGNPDPTNGDVPMKTMYPDRLSNWKPTADNPQMEVPTDYYYANLGGNWDLNGDGYPGESDGYDQYGNFKTGDIHGGGVDFTPSLFVGRIPVYNNDYDALNSILKKMMTLEDNPHHQGWQDKALLPMTFWGENYDAGTLGYLMKTNLLAPNGVTSYQMYMHQAAVSPCPYDQISSYSPDQYLADMALANRWSANPVGLMFWAGHGNVAVTALGFGYGTVNCWLNGYLFTTYNPDDSLMLNDAYPAFVFLNSCLNGAPSYNENVGYALLKQGAVSTVSASNDTWLDSTGDSESNLPTNYTSGAGIAYQYAKRLMWGYTAAEALEYSMNLDALTPSQNLQNHYDFNLYGDPAAVYTVPASTTSPTAPSGLAGDKTLANNQTNFELSWTDNSSTEEYFRINMTDNYGATQTIDMGRNTVKTIIYDVACDRTYNIQVQAGNRTLLSSASNVIELASAPCIPSAPTGLSASLVNAHIVLNWANNADVKTGFNIYMRGTLGQYYLPPVPAGSVNGSTTSFTDTSAACGGKKYLYFITAYNESGESPASTAVTIYSPMCVPTAPSGLGYGATQTSLHFTWTDNSSSTSQEDGFQLWGQPHNFTLWFLMTTLPANTTDFTLDALNCSGGSDNYEVRAFNNGGSSNSNVISAGTLACTKPAAPSNLTVNANLLSPTSLNLNWDDNSDNEQGFEIDQLNGSAYVKVDSVATDVTSYTATGLTCNTTYTFQVFAYNTLNSDAVSASGKTSACDPSAPTRFRTTNVSSSRVDLAWNKPVYIGPAPSGYQVAKLLNLSRGTHWVPIGTVTAPTVTYSDTSVSCGHTYYYSVRSVFTNTGSTTYSAYVPALTVKTPICPPNAPAALTAVPASQIEIDLSWMPPASGPVVTGYNLERADHSDTNWSQIYTGTSTTYADAALTCQTSYDYRVQAYNDSGAGVYTSPVVTAQTVVCSPAAPSNLSANSFTQTSLSLTWHDNSSNEDGFSIQRSPHGLTSWTELGTAGAGVVTYLDSNPVLTCGTAYHYRVLAYNAGGHSSPTGKLKTGTLPCSPTLRTSVGAEGLVTLTWRDASHTTTSYNLYRTTTPLSRDWTNIGSVAGDRSKYLDLAAPCGKTLYYRVEAVNPQGNTMSLNSDAVQTVCKPTTAMTLTFASATFHSIHLTWTATSGGQTSFVILRSITGTDGWFDIATLSTTDSSFVDNSLEPGTTYYYRLEAVNTGGAALSNVVHGTTRLVMFLPLIKR